MLGVLCKVRFWAPSQILQRDCKTFKSGFGPPRVRAPLRCEGGGGVRYTTRSHSLTPGDEAFVASYPAKLITVTVMKCHGGLMITVRDSLATCHEFEPSTTEDSPYRGGPMYVKSVEAQTSSCWFGIKVRSGCQLRCHPLLLTMVQNDEVRRQRGS
ncbi:hypothetical protein TNCV_4428431 [Trichonephila clavipes]|nr:hypothetical protein TNCV_4428431 [Trichonephila clavipes]